MYDHIYWMLTFAGVEHVTPPQLVPEMARWTDLRRRHLARRSRRPACAWAGRSARST